MHPILFELGPFKLRPYGLALALSFLAGGWLTLRRGRGRGLSEDFLLGLIARILLAALVGARLHFVLAHPEAFPSPLDALRIWEGGMTQYGGLIAAIIVSWWTIRRRGLSFLAVADVTAPALALGEGLTRVGCFINGCCFGRPCTGPFCVHYPAGSFAADALGVGVPVWPSQLILSAAFLIATVLLLLLDRRPLRAGRLFGIYLLLQGGIRWLVDFTRYYEPSDQIHALAPIITSRSQLLALVVLLLGLVLLLRRIRAGGGGGEARP